MAGGQGFELEAFRRREPFDCARVNCAGASCRNPERSRRTKRKSKIHKPARGQKVAGRQGFEPRYADPESAVLPLDDLPEWPLLRRTRARTILAGNRSLRLPMQAAKRKAAE